MLLLANMQKINHNIEMVNIILESQTNFLNSINLGKDIQHTNITGYSLRKKENVRKCHANSNTTAESELCDSQRAQGKEILNPDSSGILGIIKISIFLHKNS